MVLRQLEQTNLIGEGFNLEIEVETIDKCYWPEAES